jgi:hypothetical protein
MPAIDDPRFPTCVDAGHRRSEVSDLRVDDPQRVQQLRRVRTDLDVHLAAADC